LVECPEKCDKYCGEGGEVQQALAKYKKHIEGAKAVELTV
jgi:adenylosuccinate lyase